MAAIRRFALATLLVIAVSLGLFAALHRPASQASPAETFSQVSGGWGHTCGVKLDGTIACWGWNDYGQATPPSGTFSQVSAGSFHTCGVRTDGTLACWGTNAVGESTPPAGTFIQVSAGGEHTCGLGTDGTLTCWGWNDFGQATSPVGTFIDVSAGYEHTCGVKTDGTVVCWGENGDGQATPPAGTFSQVSAGSWHTCGIRTDGTLACWGNLCGQETPPGGTFSQVDAGGLHTCAIKTNGTLACWGDDFDGQATPSAGTFSQVDAGQVHTCGVKTDGTLACWGQNGYGQAPSATPTPTPSATPSPTSSLTPGEPGTVRGCPPPGNWTFSVWDGRNDIDSTEALATCGTGVDASYALDPETQVWSRWFPGRPDVSDLQRLINLQGMISVGRLETVPTLTPVPTPTPVPTLPGCSPDVQGSPLAPDAPIALTTNYLRISGGWWRYFVQWQDNSDDETCFGIEKRLDDGPWQWAGPVPTNETSYAFYADYRGRLCHRVYAGNGDGRSEYSDISCLDVPPLQGAVFNCPPPGKWAISVWVGPDNTDTMEALNTCGDGAVSAAFALDSNPQLWMRWFDGRPDISNLSTLGDLQGFLALGTPAPTPTLGPGIITGTGVVAPNDVFNFGTGDIYYSEVHDAYRGYIYGDPEFSTPEVYFADVISASPCASNHRGYQGIREISDFGSADDHTFTAAQYVFVGDKSSACYQGILLFRQGIYYGGIDILDIDDQDNLHYRYWYDPSGGTNF